jgi:hypothetical protein
MCEWVGVEKTHSSNGSHGSLFLEGITFCLVAKDDWDMGHGRKIGIHIPKTQFTGVKLDTQKPSFPILNLQ